MRPHAEEVVATQRFVVNLKLDPAAMAKLPSVYVEVWLGTEGRATAVAELANFRVMGGALRKFWMNHGATGDFSSALRLQSRPGTPPPHALGVVGAGVSAIRFEAAITTGFVRTDTLSLWLVDGQGRHFPTNAVGRSGLIASMRWSAGGTFTSLGFDGCGRIGGVSVEGFRGEVTKA